jgi:esterase/lipase
MTYPKFIQSFFDLYISFHYTPYEPKSHKGAVTMIHTTIKVTIVAVCVSFCFGGCSSHPALFQPTGRAVSAPVAPEPEFSQYVRDSRDNILRVMDDTRFKSVNGTYLGGYTSQEVALMRAPFQIPEKESDVCDETSKGGGKGFLLIHGLTDSPYIMRSLGESLHKAYPCAVIRAVLLPGHGTVPGDTLNMKHAEWLRITDYGVRSFEKNEKINDLYLVGFSTGTALTLRHMKNIRSNDKVKGLILLSPAVKARSSLIWLSGIVGLFTDWESTYSERDAARYESFSYNAAAEFYTLTKGLSDDDYKLDVPVLMAVSADDATIDANAARRFFCDSTTSKRRTLIWYRSRYTEDSTAATCSDIATVEIKGTDRRFNDIPYRVANISHTAVPVSPDDRHYGVNGVYRNCKFYEGSGNPDDFTTCQKGSTKTIFGENNIGTSNEKQILDYDYWRRGTFNPDYDRLEKSIICFVDNSCNMAGVLDLSK